MSKINLLALQIEQLRKDIFRLKHSAAVVEVRSTVVREVRVKAHVRRSHVRHYMVKVK